MNEALPNMKKEDALLMMTEIIARLPLVSDSFAALLLSAENELLRSVRATNPRFNLWQYTRELSDADLRRLFCWVASAFPKLTDQPIPEDWETLKRQLGNARVGD
jgi:hypothetical protein